MKQEVLKKIKELGPNEPFLITVTVYDKKKAGEIKTSLYSNNFPYEEMEGTKNVINQLVNKEKKGAVK